MDTKMILKQIAEHKEKILELEKKQLCIEQKYRDTLVSESKKYVDEADDLIKIANACIDSHIDISAFIVNSADKNSFGFTRPYRDEPIISLSGYFRINNEANWYYVGNTSTKHFLDAPNSCHIHFLQHFPSFKDAFCQHLSNILDNCREKQVELSKSRQSDSLLELEY